MEWGQTHVVHLKAQLKFDFRFDFRYKPAAWSLIGVLAWALLQSGSGQLWKVG